MGKFAAIAYITLLDWHSLTHQVSMASLVATFLADQKLESATT